MHIFELEKNFTEDEHPDFRDLIFFDVKEPPFCVHGMYDFSNRKQFIRMPKEIAEKVSPGVSVMSSYTSGGRVRFCTDSSILAIYAGLDGHNPNFSVRNLLFSAGFTLYEKEENAYRLVKVFPPEAGMKESSVLKASMQLGEKRYREFVLYFPVYCEVKELYIGLEENAKLEKGNEYAYDKPVVFYGSSITQGVYASRPGNTYVDILSQRLNFDYINLGFSGSAKAEPVMIDFLSQLDMRVFVCDYDHNAKDAKELERTHRKVYLAVRERNKEVSIVFISKPDSGDAERKKRRNIIRQTYAEAIASGDDKVYFVDGGRLLGDEDRDSCSVDGCHPNDLGFYRMARGIEPTLKEAIRGQGDKNDPQE